MMTIEDPLGELRTEEDPMEGDLSMMTKEEETDIHLVMIQVTTEMPPETGETPPRDMTGPMMTCSPLDMIVVSRKDQVPGPRWSR